MKHNNLEVSSAWYVQKKVVLRMSKNEKKNQHYVPKCYLRNFTDGEKYISTFIHSKSKYIPKASLDSVVSEDYFYGKDLYIENMFQEYEGYWAAAFRVIIENEELSSEDAAVVLDFILSFIAFQHCRTLRVYDSQIDFANFMKQYIRDTSAPEADVESFLNKYIPPDFNPMIAPVDAGFKIKEAFMDLSLLIIENNTLDNFITSDNPVIIYNRFLAEREFKGNYGLNSKGLCVFLPVSPKICFCLFDPKTYFSTNNDHIYNIAEHELYELNKLFCRNAYEYIFFTKLHDEDYARKLDGFFVDNLETKTGLVQSNIGPIIHMKGASILETYQLPFLTTKKSVKKMAIPQYGPAPTRSIRKLKD